MPQFSQTNTHCNSWSSFGIRLEDFRIVEIPENSWGQVRVQDTTQGTASTIPVATAVSTDSVRQRMRMRQRSACSQTISCLRYLISVGSLRVTTTPFITSGDGTYWRRYAEDGDKSYLRLHAVSNSYSFARTKLLSGNIWISGQPFLSLCNTCPALDLVMKITSSPH